MSVIAISPVSVPVASGLKATEMVHFAAAASVAPHVFEAILKDVAFVPATAIAEIFMIAVPELVSVMVCAAEVAPSFVEAKVRLAGAMVALGAVAVPFSVTFWGEPVALSVTESVAVRAPATVGLNSVEMVHVLPAARLLPQVVADFTNDVAFVPE